MRAKRKRLADCGMTALETEVVKSRHSFSIHSTNPLRSAYSGSAGSRQLRSSAVPALRDAISRADRLPRARNLIVLLFCQDTLSPLSRELVHAGRGYFRVTMALTAVKSLTAYS